MKRESANQRPLRAATCYGQCLFTQKSISWTVTFKVDVLEDSRNQQLLRKRVNSLVKALSTLKMCTGKPLWNQIPGKHPCSNISSTDSERGSANVFIRGDPCGAGILHVRVLTRVEYGGFQRVDHVGRSLRGRQDSCNRAVVQSTVVLDVRVVAAVCYVLFHLYGVFSTHAFFWLNFVTLFIRAELKNHQ